MLKFALMDPEGSDVVIWGLNAAGRSFRPSDWAERLAGLTAAFGADQRLSYSPLVRPVNVRGVKAVIVGARLAAIEPRLFQFLLGFAGDNELAVHRIAGALASPQTLVPPGPAPRGEPREPV